MVRRGPFSEAEDDCQFVIRFSLRDPKRDLRLAAGEAQRFKALDVLKERFFFRGRPVVSRIHTASEVHP